MRTYDYVYPGIGITGNVYAGTTRRLKDGNVMWTNKSDVTSEFYNTLLNLIQVNGKDNKMSFADSKTVFTITLEKKSKGGNKMKISRTKDSDKEKCTEISYMYKKYNSLVDKLIHSEKDKEIDTEAVKKVLLDIQNAIHDDLIRIVVMEGAANV